MPPRVNPPKDIPPVHRQDFDFEIKKKRRPLRGGEFNREASKLNG